jgi:hypothetical protein
MGRPLNKRYFGPPTAGGNEIKVQFNSGSGSTPGYIVKQTGSKRFNVSNAGGTDTGTCYLVDKASAALAAGEMSIVVDDNGTPRQVVKISGRTVTLDTGSKIKWDFTGTGATVEIEEAGTDANMTGADDIEGDG